MTIRVKRGLLADIPTLAEGEPGFTLDNGTERFYIGSANGNVRFARYDEVLPVTLTSAANDDIIQRKSGIWVNRSLAQLKNDLAIQVVLSCAFTGTIAGTATKYTTWGAEAQLAADQIQLVFPWTNTHIITLSRLTVRTQSKSGAGNTTVTVFKNGATCNIEASCTSGAITQDITNTAAFIGSTDRCSVVLTVPSTDTVANVAVSILATITYP